MVTFIKVIVQADYVRKGEEESRMTALWEAQRLIVEITFKVYFSLKSITFLRFRAFIIIYI